MPDASSVARPLRILWGAICASGALAMAVLGALAVTGEPPLPQAAEGAFYASALLSVGTIAGAFALARAMEGRLLRAGSDAEAAGLVRTFGVAALAVAEVPTLAGAAAAFLTGDLMPLAFGVPLFAFAWLTWPSDGRVAHWLSLRERSA
ncbi:hypothetical protein [Rubrivirga sp.]|uniref:hypothetical protein n=1 Tax=Rubrivirga sp. TaxID=1885344 RepID=UPI003B522A46